MKLRKKESRKCEGYAATKARNRCLFISKSFHGYPRYLLTVCLKCYVGFGNKVIEAKNVTPALLLLFCIAARYSSRYYLYHRLFNCLTRRTAVGQVHVVNSIAKPGGVVYYFFEMETTTIFWNAQNDLEYNLSFKEQRYSFPYQL